MTHDERLVIGAVVRDTLGAPWNLIDAADQFCKVAHPDGRQIYLDSRIGIAARGRLTVRGGWPVDDRGQVVVPSTRVAHVTFAEDRPAPAIANVVARKYMPAYTAAFDACQRRANEANAYRATSNATGRAVAKLLGTTLRGNPHDSYTDLVYGKAGDRDVNARIAGDRVELTIRGLSVDEVRDVASVLRGEVVGVEQR